MKSTWTNRNKENFVIIFILIPTGIGPEDITMHPDDTGEYLEISVDWPARLFNVDILFRRFTKEIATD